MNNTNTYELAFLALANLSEQEAEDLQSTLAERVATVGGQVVSTGDVHYIRLAYEMTKKVGSKNTRHNEAYFSWMKLSVDPTLVGEIDQVLRSEGAVLRHMIVLTESDDSLTNVFTLEQDGMEEDKTAEEEVAVESVAEVSEEETDAPAEAESAPDDLSKIEGIGPVIATTLVNAGITTYAKLADTDEQAIVDLLEGVRGNHDPHTWPQQAGLAAAGKWEALEALQAELQGGKEA